MSVTASILRSLETAKHSPSKRGSSRRKTSTRSMRDAQREVVINIYDLLPPGRLSSVLWTIGGSLLHSGVVVEGKEYAYGGHNRRGLTGVYWTRPGLEPPGGMFRCGIIHGVLSQSLSEVEDTIKTVSEEFLGPSYNILTHNCNHFTSSLCERLTGKRPPAWLNRAASVGLALPCVVPKEWIHPPDFDAADGELIGEGGMRGDERAAMLQSDNQKEIREERQNVQRDNQGESLTDDEILFNRPWTPPPRPVVLNDTSGPKLPSAERAHLPNT